jgi:hypothetical protein
MSEDLVTSCPRCGTPNEDLVVIDAGMKLALQTAPNGEALPSQVCRNCYSELTGAVSKGVKLRLEQQAREKNRHMLWKSRVNLVKHARQLMLQKAYPEAAVSYEKYIRVLEISYDLKPGELTPDVFGKSSRSKELTVVATTYWDLMRIYDTNATYRDRMLQAGKKLAQFLPFSPIFPDVIKKAQQFESSAKNSDVVRTFLKDSKAVSGKCFVATAAFEDAAHPTVEELRQFRDRRLLRSDAGLRFIMYYLKNSPRWAAWLESHPQFKRPTRYGLRVLAWCLRKIS